MCLEQQSVYMGVAGVYDRESKRRRNSLAQGQATPPVKKPGRKL